MQSADQNHLNKISFLQRIEVSDVVQNYPDVSEEIKVENLNSWNLLSHISVNLKDLMYTLPCTKCHCTWYMYFVLEKLFRGFLWYTGRQPS